jgi:hypothetical protein
MLGSFSFPFPFNLSTAITSYTSLSSDSTTTTYPPYPLRWELRGQGIVIVVYEVMRVGGFSSPIHPLSIPFPVGTSLLKRYPLDVCRLRSPLDRLRLGLRLAFHPFCYFHSQGSICYFLPYVCPATTHEHSKEHPLDDS